MPRWPEKTLAERFWEKVTKSGPDDCWEWTAFRNKEYGQFRLSAAEGCITAHRMAYALGNGIEFASLTPECVVMHTCDNPPCCNPAHLRAGTLADNNRDSWAKGHRTLASHPGEKNVKAKLSEAQVSVIRAMTIPNKDIAALYGITGSLVGQIKRRKIWTHVA